MFKKTKELAVRKKKEPFEPVIIDQQSVEVVSSFKYLAIVVDSKLSFKAKNVSLQPRLHLYL